MPKNSSVPVTNSTKSRDLKVAVRVVLGVLLAANLVAAGLILFPPGGSAEALARQMADLQVQLASSRALLETTKQHAVEVGEGRAEGDKFVMDYFLPLRTSDNTLESELQHAASASKIKFKGAQLDHEPIEGSDTLQMVGVTATLEGTYGDVLKFVHAIDQSQRLLIIQSLSAVPQQGSNTLSVTMKIDAFVRSGDATE